MADKKKTVEVKTTEMQNFVDQMVQQVKKDVAIPDLDITKRYTDVQAQFNPMIYSVAGVELKALDNGNYELQGSKIPNTAEKFKIAGIINKFNAEVRVPYLAEIAKRAGTESDDDMGISPLGAPYGCNVVMPEKLDTKSFLKTLTDAFKESLSATDFLLIVDLAATYRAKNVRFWTAITLGVVLVAGAAVAGYFIIQNRNGEQLKGSDFEEVEEDIVVVEMEESYPAASFR